MDGWKTTFLLGWLTSRCYVNFRGFIYFNQKSKPLKPEDSVDIIHEIKANLLNQSLPCIVIFCTDVPGTKLFVNSRRIQ